MNLIVDVGNTFVKFAIFNDADLVKKNSFELSEFKKQYKALKKEFPKVKSAIISSVGRMSKNQIKSITEDINVIELNSKTKLPFKNLYKTPKTLGVDRIALVSASVNKFPDKNVLIIDAGTCITYDFITNENHYLGGAISPGIRLRYKSLNNLTANLPLLETKQPKTIIGNTTESSIHSGVVIGVIKEIDVITINDEEARQLSGEYSLVVAARKIHEMGPKYVVIKKGEHGALLFHDDNVFYAPALPLEEVFDPTGAGDTFAGGFAGYLAKTRDFSFQNMKTAVIYGSTLASFCVEKFGTERMQNLTDKEIYKRLDQFKSLTQFDIELT